jgi:hypothetical protein
MKSIDVQVWSCGGGTQSGAIALLIGQKKLPTPDMAFMSDTGREKASTWPFVDGFIRPQLAKVGVELQVIKASDFGNISLFSTAGGILMPGFTTQSGKIGKLPPFCSSKWKIDIGERFLRSLGIKTATNWIGISVDEMRRVRKQHRPWLALWYPLIFGVPVRRVQCISMIRAAGWLGDIPHSACWMCPNLQDEEWIDMRDNWPDDFERACTLDEELRSTDPHFFLHASCVPLRSVMLTLREAGPDLFDRSCTGGCHT